MIKLAEIFQSGMILQRNKPVTIFGESDEACAVCVRLNSVILGQYEIKKGRFSFTLPPQPATENAKLEIGDASFERVDFGEVWIAGGQSNMHFLMKWDKEREIVYSLPSDEHLRYFETPKIAFEGEEKDGFLDFTHWAKWQTFNKENSPYFSAAATYFALKLRKALSVPVGVIGCSYGATSASAWLDESYLTGRLKVYKDEFEAAIKNINPEHYEKINYYNRKNYNPATDDIIYSETVTPERMMSFQTEGKTKEQLAELQDMFASYSFEELTAKGRHDANRPAALYGTMVKKIMPFTVKGAIWYQGCADADKAELYQELFTALIACWRRDWNLELPFIFAQLAPFESWIGNTGERFPEIRKAQEETQKTVKNIFMVSLSDAGQCDDIHPKYKRKVGERMCLQALDKVYGIPTASDTPSCKKATLEKDVLTLHYKNADVLHIDGNAINALEIFADGKVVTPDKTEIKGNTILIYSPYFVKAKTITVEFAQTPYYEVNLYNEADLPAIPFKFCITQFKQ